MRVLIDTNIFIYREDDRVISNEVKNLFKLFKQAKVQEIIHPSSIDDIKRDSNIKRREIILSKIETYEQLENPPRYDDDDFFKNEIGIPKSANDLVDFNLIYATFRNTVDFLLTADLGIHKKARLFGIEDRVLLITEAIELFRSYKDVPITIPNFLEEVFVYNLDINDPIFDSLKKDYYPDFSGWFEKISKEPRRAIIYRRTDKFLGAILIYKYENEAIDSDPPILKGKRLKISTLKVSQVGYKIGELFIRKAVELCINKNYPELYLTHFSEENDRLIYLIEEYGFVKKAKKITNNREEDIFLKKIFYKEESLLFDPIKLVKSFYPSFYDGPKINKFLIPIRPEYHDRLFVDFKGRRKGIDDYLGIIKAEGNTIKKAYLSRSRISNINQGDLILFYRSKDLQAITTICVVVNTLRDADDSESIIRFVGKRSVYSLSEIENYSGNKTLVLLFLYLFHFKKPVHRLEAIKKGILKSAPQSIMTLSHDQYCRIKRIGIVNSSFTTQKLTF